MYIGNILQSMLKRAAVFPTNSFGFTPHTGDNKPAPIDHSRIYTDYIPGAKSILISHADGNPRAGIIQKSNEGYQKTDPKTIGATPYWTKYITGEGKPKVKWDFEGTNNRFIEIDPTRLPSYKAGLRLLDPSYRASLTPSDVAPSNSYGFNSHSRNPVSTYSKEDMISKANDGSLAFTKQPFNMRQLWEIKSGDPNYMDAYIRHLQHIPEGVWNKANLQLSSPEELEAWKKYKPMMLPTLAPPGYAPVSGLIVMSPNKMRDYYERMHTWKPKWDEKTSRATYMGAFNTSASWPGFVSDAFFHELGHQDTTGQSTPDLLRLGAPLLRLRAPVLRLDSTKWIPNGLPGGIPTLMRERASYPLFQTEKQFDWMKDHAIEPYAISESEMNQALLAMNAGRYALKHDMINDQDNPNYKQLPQEALQQFKALPDFISAGKGGKEQFEKMMQLFIENPALGRFMPEQSRLVSYYQNLKAAVDTAKTPEEKQYFQNLMDRFIYSKAFLANNQKATPTYQDVYQQMYA